VNRLRELLAADRSRANALIRWGKNDCIETHPLHYVSDAIFGGLLDGAKAVRAGRYEPASLRRFRPAASIAR
jgi:hypothetical protein